MHHIREGFKGQRYITISPEILLNIQDNLLTKSLCIKKIGYNFQLMGISFDNNLFSICQME